MTGQQDGAALARVFQRPPAVPTVLSTLKASIGHLDRASGVAGLIRATMALKEKVLPDVPNFATPNPTLAAASDRFRVLQNSEPWPEADHPRRAGISSFGFGGTNAHVVLQEPPELPAAPARPGPHLLVLSARDLDALYAAVERLRVHLDTHRDQPLADVAHTLQQSRTAFLLRWAVVVEDHDDAVAALDDPARWLIGEAARPDGPVTLRLTAPHGVDTGRWSDVATAAAGLVGGELPPAAGSPEQATALAVAELLTRLNARVVSVVADPGAEPVAAAVAAALDLTDHPATGVPADAAAGSISPQACSLATGGDEADRPEFVLDPSTGEPATGWLLNELALLWQAGTKLDFARLHGGEGRRVTLPTYPFQRRRYWVDKPATRAVAEDPAERTGDLDRWTHLASWRQQRRPLADLAESARAAGPWLLFAGDPVGEALAHELTVLGADVTVVRPGAGFEQADDGSYTVRPDDTGDLTDLVAAQIFPPRRVVHALALGSGAGGDDVLATFDAAQPNGLNSVLALAGALESAGLEPVDLVVLTAGALEVGGGDLTHPEHTTLAGLVPVLGQECPGLTVRHVDLDPKAAPTKAVAHQAVSEAVTPHEGPVAWRSGRRWQRAYEPQPLPEVPVENSSLMPGSTVLVTGGLGNVGELIARHLFTTRGCKLVLTTRSTLPPRATWPEYVAAAGPDDKVARYVRRALDLEADGADVLVASADVADLAGMTAVVTAAKERFGGIDAIVHAAGVQDARFFGVASTLEPDIVVAHLQAKVHGFHHLQQLLPEVTGPRITLSSLSAILGGLSYGPYAAANAALDAYVLAARRSGQGRWITVDWDAWQEPSTASSRPAAGFEMAPSEGLEIFERALGVVDEIEQVVVSSGKLSARHDQWVVRSGAAEESADGEDDRPVEPRPELSNPSVGPEGDLETTLARIWAAVLRLEKVGVEDDFYKLGGDSIASIDLIARIRKELKVAVPVTALLDEATVRTLAAKVTALKAA